MARHSDVVPATLREVRIWAKEKGIQIGVRGRIKKSTLDAFTEETGRPIGRVETPETR